MGCGKSKTLKVEEGENVEKAEQRAAAELRESWILVEKQLEKVAKKWFLVLFERIPSTLHLFHFKDETDLENSKWLRLHAVASWRVIGRVVKNSTNPDAALLEVRTVARAHTAFKMNQQVFDTAQVVFLQVLEEQLGPSVWNDNLEQGYETIFKLISGEMLAVIENRMTKKEEEIISKKEKILEEGWSTIEKDLDNNAMKFISHLIDIAPDAMLHLPYQEATGFETVEDESVRVNKAKLYESPRSMATDIGLRGHGRLMLKTFGKVATGQKNLAALDQELRAVGKAHQVMQMRPELFSKAGEALLWLLESPVDQREGPQESTWDQEHRAAWQEVISTVVSAMTYPDAEMTISRSNWTK